jgi:hypothetical protein
MKTNKRPSSSEIYMTLGANGITFSCHKRFKTARFVPFDVRSKCPTCGGDSGEIEYMIEPTGITVHCNRLADEKFVPFDVVEEFNPNTKLYLKCFRKKFTIPLKRLYKDSSIVSVKQDVLSPSSAFNDNDIKVGEGTSESPVNIV